MEAKHFDIDIGYDEDNDIIRWTSVTDGGVPVDKRDRKILLRAIDAWVWNETMKGGSD